MRCAVCEANGARPYRDVDGVAYFRCGACLSLFADPEFLALAEAGAATSYGGEYWQNELGAARERCFGPALLRVAEVIAYCRIPIGAFVDVGAGTGWLLDALEVLLPEAIDRFHAVELYPPPQPHRTANPNYTIGTLADAGRIFDAGVCIEVIEHLAPAALRRLAADLAAVSRPGSLYLINSGQPDFVEHEDPRYLDPRGRGHIVSYSLAGAGAIFGPAGFNVIALPGRSWAFLLEHGPATAVGTDALIARLWHPVAENVSMLRGARFGELMRAAGIDTARASLPPVAAPPRGRAWLRGTPWFRRKQ
ncbi:MAG: methyltransferase domain-containing protein [Acetobacteraceae bacterium]